jgi:hypothetical protein
MKVDSPKNMGQVDGMCCRQSPLRGLVGSLIFCAVLIGFVFLLRNRGVPWFVWGGCAVLAALLVPWLLADALAKFRRANWLLRLGPDGLWINLRSYQNRHLPEAATVLHLPYEEIASARRHIDTWTTPARPAATTARHWKLESLEPRLLGDRGAQVRGGTGQQDLTSRAISGRLRRRRACHPLRRSRRRSCVFRAALARRDSWEPDRRPRRTRVGRRRRAR